MAKIGACGIACEVCGLHSKGICQGCDPALAKHIPCPILKCAADKKIQYCSRDCADFPCSIYKGEYPYSQAYLGMYQGRLKKGNP